MNNNMKKSRLIDLTGQRFGRLVVIERADDYVSPKGARVTMWTCKCDCGNVKNVSRSSLLRRNTRSCGCLCREAGIANLMKFHKNNSEVRNQIDNQIENEENIIVDNVVDNMDNHTNNNVSFTKAYSKFEGWLNNQGDKSLKTKSIMLWSALKLASEMNVIDEDTMKKMYGEFMFKQMEF